MVPRSACLNFLHRPTCRRHSKLEAAYVSTNEKQLDGRDHYTKDMHVQYRAAADHTLKSSEGADKGGHKEKSDAHMGTKRMIQNLFVA